MERDGTSSDFEVTILAHATHLLADFEIEGDVEFTTVLDLLLNILRIRNAVHGGSVARSEEPIFHALADDLIVAAALGEQVHARRDFRVAKEGGAGHRVVPVPIESSVREDCGKTLGINPSKADTAAERKGKPDQRADAVPEVVLRRQPAEVGLNPLAEGFLRWQHARGRRGLGVVVGRVIHRSGGHGRGAIGGWRIQTNLELLYGIPDAIGPPRAATSRQEPHRSAEGAINCPATVIHVLNRPSIGLLRSRTEFSSLSLTSQSPGWLPARSSLMTNPTLPIDRLGVCSWSLRPTDGADLVASLQRIGLPKVQLALGPVLEDAAAFGDVMSRLKDAGIGVASGMLESVGEDYSTLETIKATGGVRPDPHWPATRDRAERVADFAGNHAIDLVTVHAGFIPHDADDPVRNVVLERLRTLADIFAQRNVRVGLETGQESAATLLEALQALGHASVGVNFDPANMILYGMGDPVEAISLLADHVVQVHAKDATMTSEPGTWGAEVPLGSGQVDWDAFMAAVESIGRPIDVVIEREAGEDREHDILVAMRRLRGS